MVDYHIGAGGRFYTVAADDDASAYLDWLIESRAEPARLVALSRTQVVEQIQGPLPDDFPPADVIVGEGERGSVRGWWPTTVQDWLTDREPVGDNRAQQTSPPRDSDDRSDEKSARKKPLGSKWSDVPTYADQLVTILTSEGAVTPSGQELTRGPLTAAHDLARFVWWRWPHQPSTGAKSSTDQTPQIWITAPALQAAGMQPPKQKINQSVDLSPTVADLFSCRVTAATAGFFSTIFPDPNGGAEGRKVQLVLMPFLWLDAAPQRPKDMGIAGTQGTDSQLPDDEVDEIAAASELGRRIAWLAGIATKPGQDGSRDIRDPIVLPAARPASIAASLLDRVRRRSRSPHRLEATPIPDLVRTETPSLDPNLENWKNMPHTAKGDSIDVEVDQRAAYLASAGQVELGHGAPEERKSLDAALFAPDSPASQIPFALCRVTTPPADELDGLTPKLPLPHEHLSWSQPATFWATSRAVQQLLAPVADGGAGIAPGELIIDSAWVWPGHSRLLRGWADRIRDELAAAIADDDTARIDLCKNMYKSMVGGRMAGPQWPPSQRHYQQPAWITSIHADTRWRALRYATRIATEHDLYPIAGRDIDTFIYRIPADVDPTILEEGPENGKYRIKRRSDQDV
ncbi:hypothetical protein FIV07_28270 (plasmid) [Mycobacterium sp. THAF192]|nr:hypothetical protein FIV07_28270 [Mycobacterium sp. THAF192]